MAFSGQRAVPARIARSPYRVSIEPTTGIALAHDDKIVSSGVVQAIAGGWYEPEEARLACRVVEDGDDVLELGAGIGFISSAVCREKRVSSYLAVEADARLIPLLQETHRLNGVHGVEVLNALVTSDPAHLATGILPFNVTGDFRGSHIAGPNEAATVAVSAKSLNQILRDRSISVIIADIEGAERSLFVEARVEDVRHVIIELHHNQLGASGIAKLVSLLGDKGLKYNEACSSGDVVTFSRWGT